MALKKSELYSSLWSGCDELRGGMDASQYKDYVLVMLFVKYVSDKSDWNVVKNYELRIPSDQDEQKAIAETLAAMDTELAGLQAKLAKARLIKQGMMQNLLTGKIRLV